MKIGRRLRKYLITVGSVASIGTLIAGLPTVTYAEDDDTAEISGEASAVVTDTDIQPGEDTTENTTDNTEETPLAEDTEREPKDGFIHENGSWLFYKDDALVTGEDIVLGSINDVQGWFYIRDGAWDPRYTGVTNNANGWWYIKNGEVDFSYTGFANNVNGWWYIENGKVTFAKNDVIHGIVEGQDGWWNVKGSKVIFNESIEPNANGWWYIKDGKVDFNKTGVEHNYNGWWYVKNGKVQFDYTGIQNNANGWWYIKNGKVDFSKTSVEHNYNGWWYVKNGKVQFDYTGIRNNANGWWYIKNGKVDFSYTGIASNENGTWYIVNGKVDFGANGTRSVGNTTYTVSNGKITGTVSYVQGQMIAKARNYTTSTGYMILVDRSACKVGIFTGSGSNATLKNYWSCCVGSPSTPTITGVYRLGGKGMYFNTGTTGRCWYYSQIQGDYLFHSVIYDRSSSPVNIIDGTMGAHVSHGCVRLDVNNAKYIYQNIPSGSTIVIYN